VQQQDEKKRQSLKASFLAKLMSPVIGYGSDPQLSQFVYDLWMWSALGGAKNASGVSLRAALSGKSFSPEYWRTWHNGLVDLQRQLGFPTLFVTVSPFEWSTPFHVWVEDEMKKVLVSRQYLPAAETFHLAHSLTQVIVGLVTGDNRQTAGRSDRRWKQHVLRAKDGSESSTVVTVMARLEFQDGKRKRGAVNQRQSYHGSGRPHVHVLLWLENVAAIDLPSVVSAQIPVDNEPLKEVVLSSQQSYTGSGWPVRLEDSVWDEEEQVLRLRHTRRDAGRGIRAYMPDVIGGFKSHMDVLASDGRGMLLRYVASYTAKFSDSFAQEWCCDAASDYAVARRILTEYHPCEPEVFLQLAGQQYSQCYTTGTVKRMVVPPPWQRELPELIVNYINSDWRRRSMSLIEFLRKTNKSGAVHRAFRKRFARLCNEDAEEVRGKTLEEWTNRAPCRGEVMIAAVCHSRFSDAFYGQWMMLNLPFARLDDLWDNRCELVPESYRNFALALLKAPQAWSDMESVRRDLELEAHKDTAIESNLAMLRAHTDIVQDYLSGRLVLGDDPVPDRHAHVRFSAVLEQEQAVVAETMRRRWQIAVEHAWPDEWQDAQQVAGAGRAEDDWRAFCVLGPAGSGKSYTVQTVVAEAIEQNARVILVCPTRILVAAYREKMPSLDVDSIHSAFQIFRPEQETLDRMATFDLVVVEEVGQLSSELFERLMRLWDAAGQRPALVFVGDFAQLRGVEPSRACESPRWAEVKKFTLRTMRRCKCEVLKKKLEILRTNKPSREQLKFILKGHKAPRLEHRTSEFMSPEPSVEDIQWIFEETPQTTFVTISRSATARVNDIAVKSLFAGHRPLRVVPGDPEANPDNFDGTSQVRYDPMPVEIFAGLKVMLTRNINKEVDFVNGMSAIVEGAYNSGVRVRTKTGFQVMVFPWTDEWGATFFPLRVGYANTLLKMQGATLEHLTIWLDRPNVEAAGYVALSRVEYDANWRFVGDPSVHHFTPATGY
jgi:hypothetical protein